MYEAVAQASGVNVPPAEMASLPDIREVAKVVRGAFKNGSEKVVPGAVGRMVKQVGADTMLKNAKRDGAEFAWVPAGDTCPFCITLASRGWQRISKAALKGGHAEHIHANCDCTYAVRFDKKTTVEGYEPEKYREMYENAEGETDAEKMNSMRREAERGVDNSGEDGIIEDNGGIDFYVGLNGKALLSKYKDWIGDNKMQEYLNSAISAEAKSYIRSDFRKKSFIGNGDTASIRAFELATGLSCGRNPEGNGHAQKVKELLNGINKRLRLSLPDSDRAMLEEIKHRLERVDI